MPRPRNVLFLFADQHHAGVLGCEDHPDALTPNLDRLAGNGARFRRAYCQDAVCGPSRNSLFSGLYPRTTGCLANGDESPVLERAVSLQAAFQRAGHATAAFGKRHLTAGADRGWDLAASHLKVESPDDNYVDWLDARGLLETFALDWAAEFGCGPETSRLFDTSYPRAPLTVRDSALPPDATMEAWTAQRSAAFMRECAAADRPFLCFASFYRPHQPYTPLPGYRRRFDASRWGAGTRAGDGLARPPGFDRDPTGLPAPLDRYRTATGMPWCIGTAHADQQLFRDYLAAYYALVAEIDHHIGDLLATLDELGLRDDTVVVYSADHGDFVGDHGLVEKAAWGHNCYESTLRVPLIIDDPAAPRQQVCDDLVELVDCYPTLLELCDVPEPELAIPLAGRSLAARLRAGRPVGRTIAVSENRRHTTAIGVAHKLCRDREAGAELLFDRGRDPHELADRAGEDDYRAVRACLGQALDGWAQGVPLYADSAAGAIPTPGGA